MLSVNSFFLFTAFEFSSHSVDFSSVSFWATLCSSTLSSNPEHSFLSSSSFLFLAPLSAFTVFSSPFDFFFPCGTELGFVNFLNERRKIFSLFFFFSESSVVTSCAFAEPSSFSALLSSFSRELPCFSSTEPDFSSAVASSSSATIDLRSSRLFEIFSSKSACLRSAPPSIRLTSLVSLPTPILVLALISLFSSSFLLDFPFGFLRLCLLRLKLRTVTFFFCLPVSFFLGSAFSSLSSCLSFDSPLSAATGSLSEVSSTSIS